MKKLIIPISILAIATTTTFFACKKEAKSSNNQVNTSSNALQRDGKPIVIVTWDGWGRKKKDCHGNGLCKAVWFPKTAFSEEASYPHSTTLQYDEVAEQYFVELLREAPVGTPVPDEIMTLPIDEPIVLSTQAVLGQNLTFPVGEYPYIPSLGLYGGYKVYLN